MIGGEGDRLLHGRQCQQLEQVVLDHVTSRSHAVVVSGTASDPDVLGHGDLHMVHMVRVPQRLEEAVGEAQGQQVLDGLLAQIVVDAEDGIGFEDLLDHLVELSGAGEIMAEGLLDHHATPRCSGRR